MVEENQATVATDASNVISLKKLKQEFDSSKEIGVIKHLVYDNKSSVINSLQQMADKTFGEYSNPDINYNSFYG
jgi:hypothetical protein